MRAGVGDNTDKGKDTNFTNFTNASARSGWKELRSLRKLLHSFTEGKEDNEALHRA
jgi:hypothetical protein